MSRKRKIRKGPLLLMMERHPENEEILKEDGVRRETEEQRQWEKATRQKWKEKQALSGSNAMAPVCSWNLDGCWRGGT